MSCAVSCFLIFTFLQLLSGSQSLFINRYAQRLQTIPGPKPLNERNNVQIQLPENQADVASGENVQKKVVATKVVEDNNSPIQQDHLDNLEDLEVQYSPIDSKYYKNSKVAPGNVNRVQEITGLMWPMGVVPYFIDSRCYDNATVKRIVKSMNTIESVSCVIFRELEKKPKGSIDAWLYFTNPRKEKECKHSFARVDGACEVVLGYECLRPEEILHSLLHALGFRDEVTHPHRDQYIRILWENIQPQYRDLYRIRDEDVAYKLVGYDPMSLMHFHDRAFTNNGAPTITAVVPGLQITSTVSLSQLDIMRLKLAFSQECNKRNLGNLLDTCKNVLSNNHPKDKKDYELMRDPTDSDQIVKLKVDYEYVDEKSVEADRAIDSAGIKKKTDTAPENDDYQRIPNKFRSMYDYKNANGKRTKRLQQKTVNIEKMLTY